MTKHWALLLQSTNIENQQKSYLAWKFPALFVLLANSSLLHGAGGFLLTPGSGCPTHPERENKYRLPIKWGENCILPIYNHKPSVWPEFWPNAM